MVYIDTHCHLYSDPLVRDAPAVLARAADRGVRKVVVPAYDLESWLAMGALAGLPGVFLAFGLHPWVAGQMADQASAGCSRLKRDLGTALAGPPPGFDPAPGQTALPPPPVAIGEIGLDSRIDFAGGAPGLELQRAVLRAQLELAVDLDLPAILHCRGAFEELLAEIARFGGRLRGVLHAFSRGPELGRRFLAAGLLLGMGGAITRDRARARRAAAILPLDKIVLETDAPSIGLDGVPPQETEPGHVRDVAAALAALRGETPATIAEVTTCNARELFRLPA